MEKKDGESLTLADEVAKVFAIIEEHRSKPSDVSSISNIDQPRSTANIVTITILVVLGLMIAALYFLPTSIWPADQKTLRVGLQLFVFATYILGVIILFFEIRSLKSVFKDPVGDILIIVKESSMAEVNLWQKLDALSVTAIEYASKKLEQTGLATSSARSFLLGAVEKIGIIPGLIATALAVSKIDGTAGFSFVEALSLGILGFYLLMFPLKAVSMKTEQYAYILNLYLSNRRK